MIAIPTHQYRQCLVGILMPRLNDTRPNESVALNKHLVSSGVRERHSTANLTQGTSHRNIVSTGRECLRGLFNDSREYFSTLKWIAGEKPLVSLLIPNLFYLITFNGQKAAWCLQAGEAKRVWSSDSEPPNEVTSVGGIGSWAGEIES